jgi:hypothetical protein
MTTPTPIPTTELLSNLAARIKAAHEARRERSLT